MQAWRRVGGESSRLLLPFLGTEGEAQDDVHDEAGGPQHQRQEEARGEQQVGDIALGGILADPHAGEEVERDVVDPGRQHVAGLAEQLEGRGFTGR